MKINPSLPPDTVLTLLWWWTDSSPDPFLTVKDQMGNTQGFYPEELPYQKITPVLQWMTPVRETSALKQYSLTKGEWDAILGEDNVE